MARQDNPFALLGEDDDGGDVAVLVAKVESKISPSPPQPAEKPKQRSSPTAETLPSSNYVRAERSRGRGGRGRGMGSGGFGYGGNGGDEGDEGRYGGGYSRSYEGDYERRGRGGRGGGRGGRGRGRGQGFYEAGGFGSREQVPRGDGNQGKGGDGFEVQGESNDFGGIRQFDHENGRFGEEGGDLWQEARSYSSGARGFSGARGYGGRGYGGEYRGGRGYGRESGFSGGDRPRYSADDEMQNERREVYNDTENKEVADDVKEQGGKNVTATATDDNGVTGWDMPETTEMPKDQVPEWKNPDQVASEDATLKKEPEEENNQMTLDEYEKLLQEKRKALEALRTEERKVVVDKEFEGMQLVEKKREDEHNRMKLEKNKLKKKESLEKEEKVRKSLSINEFLKPAEGEKYMGPMSGRGRGGRGRGRGERGGFRGGFTGQSDHVSVAPSIEDPSQFPLLRGAA